MTPVTEVRLGQSGRSDASSTLTAALLVDFDNLEGFRGAPDPGRFSFVLSEILTAYLQSLNAVEQLLVRLYGGWNQEGNLTQRASQVAQLVAEADPFPLVRDEGLVAGLIELAVGPFDRPGLALPNTFRRRRGAVRLRRDPSFSHPTCANDSLCGARQLAKWTSGATKICPTEACTATSAEAFFVSEQKMVDTLLSVDLLEMLYFGGFASVGLVSDDSDFLPPMMNVARRLGTGRASLLTSADWDETLLAILAQSGVSVIRLEHS